MITAKVHCLFKETRGEGDDRRTDVRFIPDYADGRNKAWAAATPNLNLSMTVKGEVAELFHAGRAYILTLQEEPTD
jgi:hypothetical protein